MYKHLFGPVPSRRLGLSLGVDLLTDKACSFDCVFCEVGATTDLTMVRMEYVSPTEVLSELKSWLDSGGWADHITLAGKGEPTLNTAFGEVISGIKDLTGTPVALLSNGSLFHLESVRFDAVKADIVKVSLGAWNQESLQKLNRPASGVNFHDIISGYRSFRDIFMGDLWLEVLLVAGINDHVDDVSRIAELAATFGPDRIHINTVVRPGAERSAEAVGYEKMSTLARLFDPPAEVVVRSPRNVKGQCSAIRDILMRRPCTLSDLVKASGLSEDEVSCVLSEHARDWKLASREQGGLLYYMSSSAGPDNAL